MPAPTPTQLVGGNFTDSEGNVLANGYLTFKLNQDASVAGANICAGGDVTIYLDSTGNVASSASTPPASDQYIWANANLSPINTYYRVSGYNAAGQKVWGSNNQQVGAGVTFNLSTWVPNAVLSWFPQVQQPLLVEVAGFPFSSQSLLDFESTDSSVIITDEGNGVLNLQAAGLTLAQDAYIKRATIAWDTGAGVLVFVGVNSNSINHEGSYTNVTQTVTDNVGVYLHAAASASTSVVIGIDQGTGGSYGSYAFMSFYQWLMRAAVTQTTHARYWMGLACWNNGGTGTDGTSILSSTRYATDTPNCSTLGFRYSAGTDTTWKAVAITSGSSTPTTTVVDTGVAIDKNIHVFSMKGNGLTITYFIDGNLVATITGGGVPPLSKTTDGLAAIFCTGDNQDTNTAVGINFYYMDLSLK
jgi:hypothetical protein